MKPILFNGSMVKAILEGRKTQTRRVIKFQKSAFQPDTDWIKSIYQDGLGDWIAWSTDEPDLKEFTKTLAYPNGGGFSCPYGKPGDELWVRETFYLHRDFDHLPAGQLSGSGVPVVTYATDPRRETDGRARPARFMPYWASRITLRITDVRVERVQEIDENGALAEGVSPFVSPAGEIFKPSFADLWDSINLKRGYGWETNPLVWVVEFEREEESQ